MKGLEEAFKNLGRLKKDFSLKEFTTFKIGGKAKYFFLPFSEDCLKIALKILGEQSINYYILGGGSNLLISSEAIEGVVIKLDFKEILPLGDNLFYLGAGVSTRSILNFSLANNLGGLEFLALLPASLGGVIVNNASFKENSIFDRVSRVKVLQPQTQEIFFIDRENIYYTYRSSSLKTERLIVLGAEIEFYPSPSKKIREKIKEVIAYRKRNQEVGKFSAGCIFKNPSPQILAGKLIEELNLKGLRKGKAFVSLKHANFIINEGGADSKDVVFLIEYIKKKVYNRWRIVLEEEVERWQC
ncbi:MAG: UDP-N-acetylenolpyruvoylglucosamine reductase [Candidatus Omnitrophota bacterium]|nr:MAG: UDP-N-acetylenolpyruvoylglucosamine reductase [Candidatus Omnitrophota bacterium]